MTYFTPSGHSINPDTKIVNVYHGSDPYPSVICALTDSLTGKYARVRVQPLAEYQPCHLAIIVGDVNPTVRFAQIRNSIVYTQHFFKQKVILVDRGFMGDPVHYSIGFDGTDGRADFRNENMPGDRLDLLGLKVEKRKNLSGKIVLAGQVDDDASLLEISHKFLMRLLYENLKHHNKNVVFCPHPKDIESQYHITHDVESIDTALQNCKLLITFSSSASIKALLLGIPTWSLGRDSVAHKLNSFLFHKHRLKNVKSFLQDLAYAQWSIDEIRSGLWHQHLFRE